MGKAVQQQRDTATQDLREIHRQLEWIAHQATDYPVECSVGDYDLLFDTRDDIELVLGNLSDEIGLKH